MFQKRQAVYVKGGLLNKQASDYDIVRALRHFGLNAASFNGVPQYATVQKQIDNGNPLINLIDWRSGGGHFQFLDEYYNNNSQKYINIMDPWYGEHSSYAHDHYKSNAKFWWQLYIDNFSKK